MWLVNVLGLLFIALIIWWFWLYKAKAVSNIENDVLIEVKDGGYSPSVITVSANQPIKLRFMRTDASPCAEMLLIPQLEISKQLRLNQQTHIDLSKLRPGEYEFHCQMNMYKGVLKVI
ncbi:cupredoxin domain-containing protein [Thalassotalea aquiviva]|uniref:cupredoxin domain-containing protein n=1 Tax=Thalassotalea aquiviva TaxID=3242415 RepID=UPI00352A03B0